MSVQALCGGGVIEGVTDRVGVTEDVTEMVGVLDGVREDVGVGVGVEASSAPRPLE